jgi:hypothetical protein
MEVGWRMAAFRWKAAIHLQFAYDRYGHRLCENSAPVVWHKSPLIIVQNAIDWLQC